MKKTAKRNAGRQRRMDVLAATLLFGLVFIRYCYYGLDYFPQLDDYIRYHNVTAFNTDLWGYLIKTGGLSVRPLAGLCDVFVWPRFWGNLLEAVAILSALYAVSAVLLHNVFRRRFGTGFVFYVVCALLPLGFEGTYWVSAASHIVPGLFFAALALELFDCWCLTGKKRHLVFFAVFQFLAFCFDEQAALFSAASTLALMLAVPKSERQRAQGGWLFFVNGLLCFAVTRLAPAGEGAAKTVFYFPWQSGYAARTALPAWTQIKEIFTAGSAGILGGGLSRGFAVFGKDPNFAWLLLVLGLCFSFYVAARSERRASVRFFAELLAGVFLAAAPLLWFFLLDAPQLGVRCAVMSFCGLALVADALADLVFGFWRGGAKANAVFAAILAGLCCFASISELSAYRQSTQADLNVCSAAAAAAKDLKAPADEKRVVWLMNVASSYVENGGFYYQEHDRGVTGDERTLTGAVAAVANRKVFSENFRFVPVQVGVPFAAADSETDEATVFWFDGTAFSRVALSPNGSGRLVTDAGGRTIATLSRTAEGGMQLEMK